jgi:hypothetical protein
MSASKQLASPALEEPCEYLRTYSSCCESREHDSILISSAPEPARLHDYGSWIKIDTVAELLTEISGHGNGQVTPMALSLAVAHVCGIRLRSMSKIG